MNFVRVSNAGRIFLLTALVLAAGVRSDISAQTSGPHYYWIYLNQRSAPTTLSPQALGISERAMKRRAKVLPHDRLIDQFDYPIPQAQIDQIRATGATIRTASRWLNAVSVESSQIQLTSISRLPFVERIAPVGIGAFRPPIPSSNPASRVLAKSERAGTLNYGPSLAQLSNSHITDLHAMGIIGSGVIVGMIDDGFNNHRTHVALKNINVIAEHDFIHNITDTEVQPWEDSQQGLHGAGTLSSVAGFDPGNLIGGAYGVAVILAKTEMDSSGNADFPSEEDTYVAGLEWMERLGADIASSSLAYKLFDPPDTSYGYSSLDGHTTVVAKAASVAARKGLLLVTAMGNEGSQIGSGSFALGTLWSPADADSIVSVGATSLDGSFLASFTGTGPTADGRTKPEVVAPGEDIVWAFGNSTNQYWSVQGTSAATPLTASAAALILSAHPEFTPMQVRQALMSTAVPLSGVYPSFDVPNNFYGYGLIDAYDAALSSGPVFSNIPIITAKDSSYIVTTWIASKTSLVADSLAFYYRYPSDTLYTFVALVPTVNPHEYNAIIPMPPTGIIPVCYFSAKDASGTRTSPFNAPDSLFNVQPTSDSLRQFYPTVDSVLPPNYIPTDYKLVQNYPNPFNATTAIQFYAPMTANVELAVFNLLGQRVKILFQGTPVAGWNTARWNDAQDQYGHSVASGVYFARLKTSGSVIALKMLYVK
jgi:serine protease AprX